MVYPITPSLGINLAFVGTLPYNDSSVPSPAIGTVVKATDGHDYMLAQASAAIASAAVVALTEPAMTMATSASGQWTAPTITGGVPSGSYAWFKKTKIDDIGSS